MTIRLSPLGLPFEYGGDISVDLTGAAAPAEAGDVFALSGIPALSPLGLPLLGYSSADKGDVSITLASGGAAAEAGTVTVNLPVTGVFSQFGPLALPGPIRNIVPKVGNVSVNLVGAQAQAQGEEMEGADAIIYIDGATAFANAGLSAPAPQLLVAEGVDSISFSSVQRAIELLASARQAVISPAAPDSIVTETGRIIIFSSTEVQLSILESTQTTDID